jgi:hypothetical protein
MIRRVFLWFVHVMAYIFTSFKPGVPIWIE